MSQLLAPYNNAMRLGQGFNSYTQQILLDRAVTPNVYKHPIQSSKATVLGTEIERPTPTERFGSVQSLTSGDEDSQQEALVRQGRDDQNYENTGGILSGTGEGPRAVNIRPWSTPQIVTYSSRFVDKLSDVTDSMNISGSLSIKTATIGGKANGQYVDSDKFKSSDINFHLQVKVTNQIHDAVEYNQFNKLDIDPSRFTEIYGDCFISGWEEGGELNAVISVKVLDKSKIFTIKAGLEAELTTPSLSGKVEAKVSIEKENLDKMTETTISVNWSGGGSIKDPGDDWNIKTLKQAAAAFPDFVAVTPQRTLAILTKYTALEDFHKKQTKYSPLDYENAGIYTGALLDSFMDYKALWKQISNAQFELENNRATIEMSEISEEMAELALVRPLPEETTTTTASEQAQLLDSRTAGRKSQANEKEFYDPTLHGTVDEYKFTRYPAFPPSFAGLIRAKKICRIEMAKIVREVDVVAKMPQIATDTRRDLFFLNPLVFKQLLPVVRSQSAENAKLGVRDPTANLLIGYSPSKVESKILSPVYTFSTDIKQCDERIRQSVTKLVHKTYSYHMTGFVGPASDKEGNLHSQAVFFNDLIKLDAMYKPTGISIWATKDEVQGFKMHYSQGEMRPYGDCTGSTPYTLTLDQNVSEIFTEVIVRHTKDNLKNTRIVSMAVATSNYQILDTSLPLAGSTDTATSGTDTSTTKPADISVTNLVRPDDTRYSLRGFFAFEYNSKIYTMGVVWGRDGFVPVPPKTPQVSLCKSFLGLPLTLQRSVVGHPSRNAFAGEFLMGNSVVTGGVEEGQVYFNALEQLDFNWKIKNLTFYARDDKSKPAISGLMVAYTNGINLYHGSCRSASESWSCAVPSDLSIYKAVVGKNGGNSSATTYIDTLEFVRSEDAVDRVLPDWPLDLSTIRFLGEGEVRVNSALTTFVETAPNIKFNAGYAKWSIRGFYGTHSTTAMMITRLGVIWGRG